MGISARKREACIRNLAKRGPLTARGRERLRLSATRNRSWEYATGPRTEEGKARSRLNALKTGEHTREMQGYRRPVFDFLALCRAKHDRRLVCPRRELNERVNLGADGDVAAALANLTVKLRGMRPPERPGCEKGDGPSAAEVARAKLVLQELHAHAHPNSAVGLEGCLR